MHYCTAHTYSAESVNNACWLINKLSVINAYRLIKNFDNLDSVVSVSVEVDCQKQQIYSLRLHFPDIAIANLFVILVSPISYRRSCSILFGIRLFSLFRLMVLLCSFYHLKFRNWPFSTAFDLQKKNAEPHWKPPIWGQNPRFGTTRQIILKVVEFA